MSFDVLIIGGGVSGMQCALVLGSAKEKAFATDKKIGIFMHQKASHLQNALFNNVLGLSPGKLGSTILKEGKKQLTDLYPHINQMNTEKVLSIESTDDGYKVTSNKNTYFSKNIVVALNYSKPFTIKGLEEYVIPHKKPTYQKIEFSYKTKITL